MTLYVKAQLEAMSPQQIKELIAATAAELTAAGFASTQTMCCTEYYLDPESQRCVMNRFEMLFEHLEDMAPDETFKPFQFTDYALDDGKTTFWRGVATIEEVKACFTDKEVCHD